jgi:ADP-ribose pyrophosphatase
MDSLAWTLVDEEKIQLRWRSILRRTYRYPDGRQDIYEIANEPQVVTILCLTPARQVVLVRQFRPGPGQVLLEMPGGAVDPGEEPTAAAARELLEETGYQGDLRYVGASLCEGYSTMLRHSFVVTAARPVQATQPQPSEFLQVIEMPLEQFRAHLRGGQLTDIDAGYLCLDYLGLL